MPDVFRDYHGLEPMRDDGPEGPWFTMTARQIRKMASFAAASEEVFKIEYRGAGYWMITRLDVDGKPTEDHRMIYANETP
jgi:hypothetical protein